MNDDIKLLNEIYIGSINAITVISAILTGVGEGSFFDTLFREMTEYRAIANSALILLGKSEMMPLSMADKWSISTAKHIAGLYRSERFSAGILINGSIEGINSIVECINTCTDAKKETRLLAYKLIETEEKNIRMLKYGI